MKAPVSNSASASRSAAVSVGFTMLALAAVWALQGCVTSTSASGPSPASDEDAAIANLNLGAGYLRQDRPQLALERLQRAIDLDPRLVSAHSTIALAYDRLGEVELAEQHYRRATQLEPGNAAAANSYAVFLCRQNRWRAAEPYFERALDNPRYSTPAAARTNAGICASSAGEFERAEEYFRAALAENAAFPEALSGMMELAYRQQNYLQARAFMQRFLDVRAPSAAVLWLCVNIEQELDDSGAAVRCADQLRQDFPESSEFAQLQQLESDARR